MQHTTNIDVICFPYFDFKAYFENERRRLENDDDLRRRCELVSSLWSPRR